jgi:type II secretory pathway pseudopilin PulG
MRRSLKLRNCKITKLQNPQHRQRGYMMITLILALALMLIALSAVLPAIKQQIVRDREIELRHRGNSYARAIQHFYKKLGRYPSRLEELENTNNIRYLRKRYTDPVNIDKKTGKELDFKLLHQQDISLNNGPVLGQAPGQGGQGGAPGQSAFGGSAGGFGGLQGGAGGFGAQSGGAQPGGIQQAGNAGAQNSTSSDSSSGDSSNPSSSGAGDNSNSNGSASNSSSGSGLSGQTFGGGPILGVASLSKEKSIHVFYDKNHYNDWLFIYVPQADRGGLLTGPISTSLLAAGAMGAVPGQVPGAGALAGAAGQNMASPGGLQSPPASTPAPQSPPVQSAPQN